MASQGNAHKFKQMFLESGPLKKGGDEFFIEEIRIKAGEYKCDYCIIEDADFQKDLLFDFTGKVGLGIKLINCKGRNFGVFGCEIDGFDQSFDPEGSGSGIVLENCEFQRVSITNNPGLNRSIQFRSGTRISHLEIKDCQINEGGIAIEKTKVLNGLDIFSVTTKADLGIDIDGSEFNDKLRVFNVTAGSFSIGTDTMFSKDCFLEKCQFDSLIFNESKFLGDFKIDACTIKRLNSWNDEFRRKLILNIEKDDSTGLIEEIIIDGTSTGQGLLFYGSNSNVRKIEFVCNDSLSGLFQFYSFTNIELFEASGISQNGEISFYYSDFLGIRLNRFINYSTLNFTQCQSLSLESEMDIIHTWLGKTTFFNTNFRNFESIRIQDSQISEIEVIGNDWFTDSQLFAHKSHSIEKSSEISNKPTSTSGDWIQKAIKSNNAKLAQKKRDIYRQLKISAERQGNSIQAMYYKAKELEHFWGELRNSKSWWQRERLVLWLSSSNDMGLNWLKPLIYMLIFTCALYYPILIAASPNLDYAAILDPLSIDLYGSWQYYIENLYVLIYLFNPARSLTNVFESIDSSWIYLWDTIHRVILAYLIFQTVTAFRKYVR